MTERKFSQIDVFSDQPYKGNPLAVVHNGSGIEATAMQQFTNWTNLSEATFLLKPTTPEADYKVRIFAPGRELPFAGHPTIGSCHAWLEAGGQPKGKYIIQECGVGLVSLRQINNRLYFLAPPLVKSGPLDAADVELIRRGLGLQPEQILKHSWCDNGPRWRVLLLHSAETVRHLRPDYAILAGLDVGVVGPVSKVGMVAPQSNMADADFEVRAFFRVQNGMAEDPVTGSLNAGIAQWLIRAGLAPQTMLPRRAPRSVGLAGCISCQTTSRFGSVVTQ